MKKKSLSNRTVQWAFGSAIVAVLVVSAISYRGMALSGESDGWVRHTHEVIENLQDLLLEMRRAESSERGFLLSGDENSLRSYHDAVAGAEQIETSIRNLTMDNAAQQRNITILVRLAEQKIQFAESVIELRRTKGMDVAADFVRAEDGERTMDEFHGVVNEMEAEELRLLVVRDADAKRRLLQTKAILMIGTGLGLLIAAAAGWSVQREGSRREIMAEALREKVDELNRSNEELGQFAYIASHDLQEPLRMVASYTQLLSKRYKGKLDSDADEFIAFAVDGANRMQSLIQDLLAYSRVGTKGKDLRETSSEDALQLSLLNLRGAIEDSGALVTHDPLPAVLADESQLVQLFQNLVGNAIKYKSPDVPKIHVSATRNGGNKWTFSVRDNGLGIDPQYFDRIFVMFQRLHKREEYAGTGIGLAICKKIVERHGGSIAVESQLGQGSIFRFVLDGNRRK